jgi:chromosome segregation ATPase
MKTAITLTLTILTVLGLQAGHDHISHLERDLACATRDLDTARHNVNRLGAEESRTRSCFNTANSQLAAATRACDAIDRDVRKVHGQLNALRTDANVLQARKNSLERRLACAPAPTRHRHGWHYHTVDPNAGLRAELAAIDSNLRCVRGDITRLECEDRRLHAAKPGVLAKIEQCKRVVAQHAKTLDRIVCDLRNARQDMSQQQARVNRLNHELQVARCNRPVHAPQPVVVYEERHEHQSHRGNRHSGHSRSDRHSRDAHIARDIGAIFGLFAHLASH